MNIYYLLFLAYGVPTILAWGDGTKLTELWPVYLLMTFIVFMLYLLGGIEW